MKVFIACSAKENVANEYKNFAIELSTFLAKRGHKLVFGGCDTGMMGKCFYTFKYENGKTKGITDVSNAEMLSSLDVNASLVTPSVFERTKALFTSSDLVIFLPGGIGTYGELFSIIDETRVKKSNYPIILFNYKDFYTPLLSFLKNSHKEGFLDEEDIKMINVVTNLKSLEKYIDEIDRKEEE